MQQICSRCTHQTKQTSAITTTTGKKKNCACCAKETANIVKRFKQSREKINTYQKRYTQATDIITQYGFKKGLRKLKQSDPEIAVQFERFLVEHPVDSKNARSSP